MVELAAQQRYELLERIGRGGQGSTFVALDRATGRQVAVKRIKLNADAGWKPFDLFERECRVLQKLSHPGIPKYLDSYADEAAGEYFLVMELITGRTLRRVMEGPSLSEAQLWSIFHQALAILDALHGVRPPVIHRDIKPDNLIQRDDGSLCLVDFGGVRMTLRPDGGSTVIGTFGYMAPEQLHGDATPATDLFGLGATIAALATGSEADALPRKGLAIDLSRLLPPSTLREVLTAMLEPDPDKRLASVAMVRKFLERASKAGRGKQQRSQARPERGRPARPPAQPDAPAAGGSADRSVGDDDGDAFWPTLVRIFGSMGYLGLMMLEHIMLPIIFVVLSKISSPHNRPALAARKEKAKALLKRGRKEMRRLSQSEAESRKRLPPGRRSDGSGHVPRRDPRR